jgi:asparagine synthase (glutamine-hydrolysing)
MCGIAGFINLSGRVSPDAMGGLVKRMADSFAHRGPDDSGVWVDPGGFCAFSHRRLSIIDLSPGGHQPMLHANGSALTFNGEIYNYQDLRANLGTRGHKFHSTSDTEVLLAGLVDEGKAFVKRLDAMFAFGAFDPARKSLLLARDIFGEKPLYYAQTADWFAFASELQALTLLPGFDAAIDPHRIAAYLALQYLPAPLTIYNKAQKLPPGHTLMLTEDGRVTIERFFHFSASPQQTGARSLDDLADELEHVVSASVKTRMLSDVPLGAFLSGGVDSSTVVALARRYSKQPIQTFSIGFEGSADSEHEQARAMAAHLGTNHHDKILQLDALELGRHISGVLDEPNGDTSCLPTWILSRMTREHVTVALSGDGGDELFGGYGRYLNTLRDAAEHAGDASWRPGQAYYSNRILIFPDQTLEKFIGFLPEATKNLLAALRAPLDLTDKPLLQRLRETDIENYMPGAVLAKVDRMSMQHALEVRAPLLGRGVADFAMRMAADDLCVPGHSKRVLKQLAARSIPRAWLDRPKMGFGMPISGWGGAELAAEVSKLLLTPECRLAAWIAPERLKRFAEYHQKTPGTYQLWTVFVLELWLRDHPGHPAL